MKLSKLIIRMFLFCVACPITGYTADDEVYIACDAFSTKRVNLQRICSAAEEIDLYKAIYAESGFRNSWFSCGPSLSLFNEKDMTEECQAHLEKDGVEIIFDTDHDRIQKEDIKYFKKKELLGFYKSPMSFADYIIRSIETSEIVGRFIFKDRVEDGRIEKGIYLFEKFRKIGLGVEILTGILKNVIDPAIGKTFAVSYLPLDFGYCTQRDFKTKTFQNFKGVYSTIAPFYNYPSLSANCKVGCSISWRKQMTYAFYPQGDETCMEHKDIEPFKEIIRTLFLLNKGLEIVTKEVRMVSSKKNMALQPDFFFQSLAGTEKDPIKDTILDNLYLLLDTPDLQTLKSTEEALASLGEDMEEESDEGQT